MSRITGGYIQKQISTDSLQQFVKLRRELTEERGRIQERLSQINEALGELSGGQAAAGEPTGVGLITRKLGRPPGKRTMSPEARARIAAAQRARWAASRGEKTSAYLPAKPVNG
jgi:hypothetical protein